jgi:hypothetical protein
MCVRVTVLHKLIGTAVKIITIALAMMFALSGTAIAQNGTAGGPTSLSGTGSSTNGGDTLGR